MFFRDYFADSSAGKKRLEQKVCFLCNTFGKILVRFTWDWTTLEENYLLGLPEIYLKLKLMLIQFIAGRVYPLSVESLVVYPTYLTASLVQSHLWFLLDIMATAENDFERTSKRQSNRKKPVGKHTKRERSWKQKPTMSTSTLASPNSRRAIFFNRSIEFEAKINSDWKWANPSFFQ